MSNTNPFPFPAVTGLSLAKSALCLLAVDPTLQGALIAGPPGSAKSTLVRGFMRLWRNLDTGIRFCEVPLNVTEDRLLGSLDIQRTLESGMPALTKGILSDAAILYVDEANLVDPAAAILIAQALDRQTPTVEAEERSGTEPAGFCLLGTYDPAEGEVNSAIRDRVALLIEETELQTSETSVELTDRRLKFDTDPAGFAEQFEEQSTVLRDSIAAARARLDAVTISQDDIRVISETALTLGVEGNRADIFAVRAARANAAFEGRRSLSQNDLELAVRLVLLPRARQLPEMDQPLSAETASKSEEQSRAQSSNSGEGDHGTTDREFVLPPADAEVSFDSPVHSRALHRRSDGRRRGIRGESVKGQFYRSLSTARPGYRSISISSTLTAAAGRLISQRAASDRQVSVGQLPRGRVNASGARLALEISPEDLRYKRLKQRSGTLFIFAVDASGSMAVNRMAFAKGAMLKLLTRAYRERNKVSLIRFRGATAEVVLEPTRSVELARRLVDAMPAGGRTPIAAALIKALELSRVARLRGAGEIRVLLFTDGRSNVHGARAEGISIQDELRLLGHALWCEDILITVIDTRLQYLSGGEALALAEMICAEYLYLPGGDADSIAQSLTTSAAMPSWQNRG